MLSLYIPRRSPIHALPAAIKGMGLAIASVGVFLVADPGWLLVGLGLVVGLFGVARLPWRAIVVQLRAVGWLLGMILVLQGLSVGWLSGIVTVLRFLVLVLLANLVSLTTRMTDLIEAIERGIKPLAKLGVDPDQVSLLLAMALRFIPVLLEQWHEIQEAQQARGLERQVLALLVPWLVKTLRMADAVTEALEARTIEPDP